MIRKLCGRVAKRLFRCFPFVRPLAIELAARIPIAKVRGHALFRKGHTFLLQGKLKQAYDCYNRSIFDLPDHPASFLYRGKVHMDLGNFAAAEDDFRITEELRPLPEQAQRLELLQCRANALIQLNRTDEGLRYYARAACLRQLQYSHRGGPGQSDPEVSPELLQTGLIDAHDMLAEDVINRFGRFDQAFRIYESKWKLQEELLHRQQLDKLGLLVLSEDWVRNVGHIGFVDFIVKMQRLGWRAWKQIILLAPPDRTANRAFVEFWSQYVSVVTDPFLIERLTPLAIATGNRVAGAIRTPDGGIRYFLDAIGTIQSHWERAGHGPLLTLNAEQHQRGRAELKKLGIPEDAWFVCVHVRESGFHKQGDPRHQAHRDASIASYIPAFREITDRGGWVIRMGDASMQRLPALARVVDYPHTSVKSEWLDVYLSGACRFFIGVASGLSHVAFSFGRPCVYTNWISNVLPPFGGQDLFVMKRLRSATTGRQLTLDEMLQTDLRRKCYSNLLLLEAGLEVVDSTPDELRDAVLEMLEQLQGNPASSPSDAARQAAFRRIAAAHALHDFCRLGHRFLRSHPELLALTGNLPVETATAA